MRGGAWLLLALAACGDATPIDPAPVALQLQVAAGPFVVGAPFELVVTRSWRDELQPGAWSVQQLQPLILQLRDSRERRQDGRHEVREQYDAYLFVAGPVAVAPASFTATPRGGGTPQVATAPALQFEVRSALPPGDAGDAELPGGLLPLPGTPWTALGLGALMLGAGASSWWWWRRRGLPRRTAAPRRLTTPEQLALERLAQLRGAPAGSDAAVAAFYVETAQLLRQYLEQRFGLPALERTSEEFLAAQTTRALLAAEPQRLLGALLQRCDLVKFARAVPSAAERHADLESATRFVAATSAPGAVR